jgi:hypothetical protein
MTNGFRNGNAKIANGLIDEHNQFLQEQLMEAQQSLFFARSVREARFLQTRIDFLKKQLKGTKLRK